MTTTSDPHNHGISHHSGAKFTALCILGAIFSALIGLGLAFIGPVWTLIVAVILGLATYTASRRRLSSNEEDPPTDGAPISENTPTNM